MIIKIMLVVIMVICCGISTKPNQVCYADSLYAQITTSNAYLLNEASIDTSISNLKCKLELSYYCEIEYALNPSFYKVQYNGASGYVKSSAVKKVLGTPSLPYPKHTLTSYSKNCYLRSTPTQTGKNNIMLIPANSTNIQFIGYINGSQVEDFGQDTWYYVKIDDNIGYVYSGYIQTQFSVFLSSETLAYDDNSSNTINPLSNSAVALIVVLLIIPSIVIINLMYSKPKIKKYKIKVNHTDVDDSL